MSGVMSAKGVTSPVRPHHGLLQEALAADLHGLLQQAVQSDAELLNKAVAARLHPSLAAGLRLPSCGQKCQIMSTDH